MKKLYVLLLLALISCNANNKEQNKATQPLESNIKVSLFTQDSLTIKHINSLKKHEFIKLYGKPLTSTQFILDNSQGEFRNNITYAYSEKDRHNKNTRPNSNESRRAKFQVYIM
mgnify:CR=1 FL=1